VERFRAYVRSVDFLRAFNGLDPARRSSTMRTYVKAETLCEAMARLPKPKRIDAKRVDKVDWSDPVMVDKLADAYARSGGDDEKAARILGVTPGSARLARRRHLGRARSSRRQNAVEAAGTAFGVQDRQRHVLQGGFPWPRAPERRRPSLPTGLAFTAGPPFAHHGRRARCCSMRRRYDHD
jgi:hypothetical protein